jgi:hypothetical protein
MIEIKVITLINSFINGVKKILLKIVMKLTYRTKTKVANRVSVPRFLFLAFQDSIF